MSSQTCRLLSRCVLFLWLTLGPLAGFQALTPPTFAKEIDYSALTGSRMPIFDLLAKVGLAGAPESLKIKLNDQRKDILRLSILSQAQRYADREEIPYVWGGGSVTESKQACLACRRCIKVSGTPLKQRRQRCKPCRKCGLDCSHFVQRVYGEVGLDYPYAATSILNKLTPGRLKRRLKLVTLGRNLKLAQPGDLLLYEKHIVLLLKHRGNGRGDIVHATKMGDKWELGGVKVDRNVRLKTYRRSLKRVLRHKAFFENPFESSRS